MNIHIEFRGKSEADVTQQKREYSWLKYNIDRACDEENKDEEEKYQEKMSRWLDAHPYVKRQVDEQVTKYFTDNPQELISEGKRRGILDDDGNMLEE